MSRALLATAACSAEFEPRLTTRYLSRSKPRGIKAGRKLRIRRRGQRWADKDYKKRNLGTWLKANPFAGSSHAKGIVLEKVYVLAPNSLPGSPHCDFDAISEARVLCGDAVAWRPSSRTLPSGSASVCS